MFAECQLSLKKEIIIYGAGDYGRRLLRHLQENGYSVSAFCETKKEKDYVQEIKVLSVEDLKKIDAEKYTIMIAVANGELSKSLRKNVTDINNNLTVIEVGDYISNGFMLSSATKSDVGQEEDFSLNYRRYVDMLHVLKMGVHQLPVVDYIVGVPRSGLIPAAALGLLLNKPVLSINEFLYTDFMVLGGKYTERIDVKRDSAVIRVLIVDDSCGSGNRICKAREEIRKRFSMGEIEDLYACVYVTEYSKQYVDYYFEICEFPRAFEWNVMNHPILSESAVDFDGVLCVDPTAAQNDDGEKYVEFIKSAKALYIPKYEIGAIVTSRLEKYRALTEEWLKTNGIKYRELIMLNLPDKETRLRYQAHASFKTDVYRCGRWKMFVESNIRQAQIIHSRTNRCVLCTENMWMYQPVDTMKYYRSYKMYSDGVKTNIENKIESLRLTKEALTGSRDSVVLEHLSSIVSELNDELHKYSILEPSFEEIEKLSKELKSSENLEKCISLVDQINIKHIWKVVELAINRRMLEIAGSVREEDWKREHEYVCALLKKNLIYDNDGGAFSKEVAYLKKKNQLMLYPYEFESKYKASQVVVCYDSKAELKYVIHNGKKLFFPYFDEERIRDEYNQLIMEQDEESPHKYFSNSVNFHQGGIFIDVGSAEGIISLDIVDDAKEVYLIEASDTWGKALRETFRPYQSKVHIIPKYCGMEDTKKSIRLDTLLENSNGEDIFIKMDVEGMEYEVLEGAEKTLRNNKCQLSCTTYHTNDAAEKLSAFFDRVGYQYEFSNRYMLFFYGYMTMRNGKYDRVESPFFRKALIRAKR